MPERHVHCLIMIIRPWEGPSHTHFAFDKEMHGRPREYKKKLEDPVFQEGYKKKVDAIRKGTALILECRKLKRFDSVALDASAKLLKVVPEVRWPLIR